jgi:hypothetical protein
VNTGALKAFAPALRRELMEAVARKLDVVLAAETPDYRTTFALQVAALGSLARGDRAGLVERVAYTWFNRLTALRYLDARGWHPFRARVLTAGAAGDTQPELLKLARDGALPAELARHTNPVRLDALLDERVPSPDPQGEVYRHLVLAACRFYHALLPDLFERLDDLTELLLPDDLLTEHSVVQGFRTEITDEDCADVEVIGWLYQFYISDKKDKVMARKTAVPTADIPAVTQLFTPHWIVRYLVENSLGRLWLLNRPSSRLREQMPYYIEGETEIDFLKIEKPEEIRVLDPAVGSGHMLTYAFELLYAIYEEEGYAASEIPGLILQYNLYGVEIDPRAAQLAELALILKARERSRQFFQPGVLVQPHVIALQDVRFDTSELRDYVQALDLGPLFNEPVRRLLTQFQEATTFGSLIQPVLGAQDIEQLRRTILQKNVGSQLFLTETHQKVLRVLQQAEYLTQRYHVAVTNPPYMGSKGMTRDLARFAKQIYPQSSADLFAMFIQRCLIATVPTGFTALVTMHSWMFLSSYDELRATLIADNSLLSMAHLGPRAFDAISGEVVQATAFVLTGRSRSVRRGEVFRLIDGQDEAEKTDMFLEASSNPASNRRFTVSLSQFSDLPGSVFAYWLSEQALKPFLAYSPLSSVIALRKGLTTMDNDRFLRRWHEVGWSRTKIDAYDATDARTSGAKWFPLLKGGGSRKWFGLNDYVINWENNGSELKSFISSIYGGGSFTKEIRSEEHYFKPSITWSTLSSAALGMRINAPGSIFESKGSAGLASSEDILLSVMAFCNSRVASVYLTALSPTLDYNAGPVSRVPYSPQKGSARIARTCVAIAKADWDNFETSWHFPRAPVLSSERKRSTLSASWETWAAERHAAICQMQELETENNQLYIDTYGLHGELQPEVSEGEITLFRADQRRDAAAFLSYAVGCVLGRYSLDKPGLILADPGDTVANYLSKVGKRLEELTFPPDMDGVIPVLDGEWFEDDIVGRTREFLRATFGQPTISENLRWLEESLGKDLRKYFLSDFYRDHLQTYRKRPIYWLVQSPKRGFSALMYLHRYTRDTLNIILNRYLREFLAKLRSRLAQLTQALAGDSLSAGDRSATRKEAEKLTKVLHECEDWEREALLPLAQQRIDLDLDDGVKINYLKLADVLAPVPGLAASEN